MPKKKVIKEVIKEMINDENDGTGIVKKEESNIDNKIEKNEKIEQKESKEPRDLSVIPHDEKINIAEVLRSRADELFNQTFDKETDNDHNSVNHEELGQIFDHQFFSTDVRIDVRHGIFSPEIAKKILYARAAGADYYMIANVIGINLSLIKKWEEQYPSFKRALNAMPAIRNMTTINALYEMAIKEHNFLATQFILTNEMPDRYKVPSQVNIQNVTGAFSFSDVLKALQEQGGGMQGMIDVYVPPSGDGNLEGSGGSVEVVNENGGKKVNEFEEAIKDVKIDLYKPDDK